MKRKKNYKRIIALTVAVCILAGAAATVLAVSFPPAQQAVANAVATSQDRQTAQELSDMTGLAPYRLLELKREMGDWNRVLQAVQDGGETAEEDLTDEELAERCSAFASDEVEAAEALVERVVFSLREIIARQQAEELAAPAAPTIAPAGEPAEEERGYEALEASLQKNRAIWLVLATAQAQGSQQAALDEYLYSLQVGVDYELYLTDAEEYEKQAAQQSAGLTRESAITVMEIEQALLELLSGADGQEPDAAAENPAPSPGEVQDEPGEPEQSYGVPAPAAPSAVPGQTELQRPSAPKPGAEVYEEIESINRDSRRSPAAIGGTDDE